MGLGDLAGGLVGGAIWDEMQPGGGDMYSSEIYLPGHVKKGLTALRGMLSGDDLIQGEIGSRGYFSPKFNYWDAGAGYGKSEDSNIMLGKWREQLMGAAKTASNPILRAVSDQVEADFARRGLTTGGAAGATKARAMMDIAARIALPVEQQLVGTEQQGIQGKYGLQQYAMNLALGSASGIGGMEQAPYKPTFLGSLVGNVAEGAGKGFGAALGAGMV